MIKGGFEIKVLTDRCSHRGKVAVVEIYDASAILADQVVVGPVGYDLELGMAPT